MTIDDVCVYVQNTECTSSNVTNDNTDEININIITDYMDYIELVS